MRSIRLGYLNPMCTVNPHIGGYLTLRGVIAKPSSHIKCIKIPKYVWLYSMHPSIQYSPHVWYHLKLDILNSYRLNWLNHLNPPNPKIKSFKSPNIARKISLNHQPTTNLSTFSPRKSAESPLFDTSSSVSPPSAAASDTTPDLASERLRPPAAATSTAVTRGLLVARTAFTTLSLALGGAHKLVFNYFYCLWWYLVIIRVII